jgi:hypothetical protein
MTTALKPALPLRARRVPELVPRIVPVFVGTAPEGGSHLRSDAVPPRHPVGCPGKADVPLLSRLYSLSHVNYKPSASFSFSWIASGDGPPPGYTRHVGSGEGVSARACRTGPVPRTARLGWVGRTNVRTRKRAGVRHDDTDIADLDDRLLNHLHRREQPVDVIGRPLAPSGYPT